MLYKNEKSVLEAKLNAALDNKEEKIISELMKLALLKKANVDQDLLVYSELYNLLGLEGFTNLISLMDGRTVTFPKRDDFKETLVMILCYYWRNVQGKSWDEIKVLMGDPNINTIRVGIQASQFEKYLKKMIEKNEQY